MINKENLKSSGLSVSAIGGVMVAVWLQYIEPKITERERVLKLELESAKNEAISEVFKTFSMLQRNDSSALKTKNLEEVKQWTDSLQAWHRAYMPMMIELKDNYKENPDRWKELNEKIYLAPFYNASDAEKRIYFQSTNGVHDTYNRNGIVKWIDRNGDSKVLQSISNIQDR